MSSPPRGGGGGKGDRVRAPPGKGRSKGPRTTGKDLPKLFSVHKGTVVSCRDFGAFVRLGEGDQYKDGLMHISRLSASGRVEAVTDVVAEGDPVFVKVTDVKEEEGKYGLDMRYVNQRTGEDDDPNNLHVDAAGGKGKGGKPEPIRIGAVQATTCTRCGSKGHFARECFADAGTKYDLVEEPLVLKGAAMDATGGHDPAVVKAALDAYMRKQESGGKDKKNKKDKKKEKKTRKKEMKKEKKEQKKKIKDLKNKIKEEKKVKKEGKGLSGDKKSKADEKSAPPKPESMKAAKKEKGGSSSSDSSSSSS